MKLTFRRHEVKNLPELEALVAENAETIEPGFRVIAGGVNLGRSIVELLGLDVHDTPALVALGFVGDDSMLFRMVEAYAWALEYPDSVRRLVPGGGKAESWPPRVMFVAGRLPDSFLRKIRLLRFPAVSCFEYRCVEVNDAPGFYLDPIDWQGSAAMVPAPSDPPTPWAAPRAAGRDEARAEREAPPAAAATAVEPVDPNRWLELLTTTREMEAIEHVPAPVPAVASQAPVVEKPVAASSREVGSSPAPVADAEPADDHELTPSWRKFLEKLAETFDFDTRPAPAVPAGPSPSPGTPPPAVEPAPAREPVASRPGASRNGAPAREERKHRALVDAVKLPPSGELAPQWRQFFEKPDVDDEKIAAVREYLHREFPMCTIYDFYEFQRNAQVFQLQDGQGKVAQVATISVEFLEAHRDSELDTVLERMQLGRSMRQAGQAGVLLTPSGLEAEKR